MTGPGIPISSARYFPAIFVPLAFEIRYAFNAFEGPIMNDTITAITPDPKVAGRSTIAVDGRPVATLPVEIIEQFGLMVGSAIALRRDDIMQEDAVLRAHDRGLRLLAVRAHSADELERKLVRTGEAKDVAKAAVTRLHAAGFLDDADYAQQFVRLKTAGAGLGVHRLRQELSRRGIERSVASKAIDEVLAADGDAEADTALRGARKKFREVRDAAPDVQKRRLYAYLARRGFSHSVISNALSQLLAGIASEKFDEETM